MIGQVVLNAKVLNAVQENCNMMVASAFLSIIQLWNVMISNDGGLVTREIGLSGEKGFEENPVTFMGIRCLNAAS